MDFLNTASAASVNVRRKQGSTLTKSIINHSNGRTLRRFRTKGKEVKSSHGLKKHPTSENVYTTAENIVWLHAMLELFVLPFLMTILIMPEVLHFLIKILPMSLVILSDILKECVIFGVARLMKTAVCYQAQFRLGAVVTMGRVAVARIALLFLFVIFMGPLRQQLFKMTGLFIFKQSMFTSYMMAPEMVEMLPLRDANRDFEAECRVLTQRIQELEIDSEILAKAREVMHTEEVADAGTEIFNQFSSSMNKTQKVTLTQMLNLFAVESVLEEEGRKNMGYKRYNERLEKKMKKRMKSVQGCLQSLTSTSVKNEKELKAMEKTCWGKVREDVNDCDVRRLLDATVL
jgi:hypothetical protein